MDHSRRSTKQSAVSFECLLDLNLKARSTGQLPSWSDLDRKTDSAEAARLFLWFKAGVSKLDWSVIYGYHNLPGFASEI
jgi:hypothetical protein